MKNEELPVHWSLWLHQRTPRAFVILPMGLVIVMGTRTPLGAAPVLAVLCVPLCSEQGFGLGATALLVVATATVDDTSFRVSDITLAPTSRLDVDGQHDYI